MILIRRTGATQPASPWFVRLRPGDVVPLQLDKRHPAVHVFRRHDSDRGPVLVEMGASAAAIDRALAAIGLQPRA